MGTSVPETKSLGFYFRMIGFISLLLLGLGIMFGVFSYFIEFGYFVPHLSGAPAGDLGWLGLGVVAAILMLVMAALIIVCGAQARRGVFPEKTVLTVLLLAAIAFVLSGVGMISLYSTCGFSCRYSDLSTVIDGGIISLIAGVMLIVTFTISRGQTLSARVMRSMFGLIFGILVMFQVYWYTVGATGVQWGFYGILQYLASVGTSGNFSAPLLQNINSLFNPLGVLDWSYFTGEAVMLATVGLVTYAVMAKSRAVAVATSFIIVLVGALVFAIGLVWSSLSQLAAYGFWSFVSSTPIQGVMPAIAEVVFVVAGFLLIAAACLGMAVQGQGLGKLMVMVPASDQVSSQPVAGVPASGQATAGP